MLQATQNSTLIPSSHSHALGRTSNILTEITKPQVNLALWQRPIQQEISHEVAHLHGAQLLDVRRPSSLVSMDNDVCDLLQQQGVPPENFENLRADLAQLAGFMYSVSQKPDFTFRLFTTDRDDCRRFHLDRTNLRMMCTYKGPGSEWLTDPQVDRGALARGEPNEAIIRFGEPSHFQPFWVGIHRGDPLNVGEGLVHRSPPLEGSGQVRVLLCLDC